MNNKKQTPQAPNQDRPNNRERYPDIDKEALKRIAYLRIERLSDKRFFELILSTPRHLLEPALIESMSTRTLYKFTEEIKRKIKEGI